MALIDIVMPQLGESIAEGNIARWLKAVGDTVAEDEPLLGGTDKGRRDRASKAVASLRSCSVKARRSRSRPLLPALRRTLRRAFQRRRAAGGRAAGP